MAGPIQLIGLPSVYPNAREITFNGATGENKINLQDNLADALLIQEGSNKYIGFVTTNSSELIEFGKNLSFDGAATIDTSGNALLTLTGGTAGVRIDDIVGIGRDPITSRMLAIENTSVAPSGNSFFGIHTIFSGTLASTKGFFGALFGTGAFTLDDVGTHADIANIYIDIISLTETNTSNVNRLSSLYILGAPTYNGDSGDITNGPYSIFVDAGDVRFDGGFGMGGAEPQARQTTIVDADGTLADITTKFNVLLADLEGFGMLATS